MEPHEFIQNKSQYGRRLPRCRILGGGGNTRRQDLRILKKPNVGVGSGSRSEARSRSGVKFRWEKRGSKTLSKPSRAHKRGRAWKTIAHWVVRDGGLQQTLAHDLRDGGWSHPECTSRSEYGMSANTSKPKKNSLCQKLSRAEASQIDAPIPFDLQ